MVSLSEDVSPRGDQWTLDSLTMLAPFCPRRDKNLLPWEHLPVPDMNVLFAAYLTLGGTTIWVPTKYLIHRHEIQYNRAPQWGNPPYNQKRCERELIIMGSSGLITSCPIRSCQPKTAGIAHRRYNWISSSEAILFKDREPSLRTVSPGTTASMSLNYKLWLPCEHS